jgi:hypothetical protein
VRCKVKSLNERNPLHYLPPDFVRATIVIPLAMSWRKEWTTSNHHAPYVQGYTHATMVDTMGCNTAMWSQSRKVYLSTNRGLQLVLVKMELLVNAGQLYCVEYVPGPCTHRPSHHSSGLYPKTHTRILAIGRVEGVIHEKGEVVTRQVYENVRLDHLLSKELFKPLFFSLYLVHHHSSFSDSDATN